MKDNRRQIGAWENWPKADQERYKNLRHRLNDLKERLSVDEFRWFMKYDQNLKFFRTLRTRYAIRNRSFLGPGAMAVNGFNTVPR